MSERKACFFGYDSRDPFGRHSREKAETDRAEGGFLSSQAARPLSSHFSPSEVRRCPRCMAEHTADDFARDSSKASGRKSQCKECDNAKSRAYYEANRERVLARVKAQKRRAREERAG